MGTSKRRWGDKRTSRMGWIKGWMRKMTGTRRMRTRRRLRRRSEIKRKTRRQRQRQRWKTMQRVTNRKRGGNMTIMRGKVT